MRPYCIMTLSFHGKLRNGELTLDGLLGGLKKVGIEAIEPATSLFPDRPDLEAELPRAAAAHGLTMASYDALCNFVDPDASLREAAVDSIRQDLERCARWSIPVCMVAGSRMHPDISAPDARKMVADGMNACQETAGPLGITLLLESFGVARELHAASADLFEVFAMCDDAIKITFDMGNYVYGGDDPTAVVDAWLPHTAHVHIKDVARVPDDQPGGLMSNDGHRYVGCRLDQGAVQCSEVLRKLKAGGYAGALSLEMGGVDLFDEVASDLAVVKAVVEG